MKVCETGTFFQIKGRQKQSPFCQNDTLKSEELDIGVVPPSPL